MHTELAGMFRRLTSLGPAALVLLQVARAPRGATGRLGLSRGQALDLILRLSEASTISPSYLKILRGAADVIGMHGVDAPSIDDILLASDVSRRTFYQFFRNKTEVLRALTELLLRVLTEVLCEGLRGDGTAKSRVRDMVRGYLRAFDLGGFLLQALLADALGARSALHPALASHLDAVADALAAPQRTLRRRDEDKAVLRARLSALLAVALSLQLSPESSADDFEHAERLGFELFAVS